VQLTVYTNSMLIQQNQPLAGLTAFNVGGAAEKLVTIKSGLEIDEAINEANNQVWPLGYGTNVLISDQGLPGTTLLFRNDELDLNDNQVVAGAGLWWDDMVKLLVDSNLWGLELTSGVPGSVGAAVFININAYGQSQSDCLSWVEVFDLDKKRLQKINAADLTWGYKTSDFQLDGWQRKLIVRAAYELASKPTIDVTYQSAIDIKSELGLKDTLADRRATILETRRRAGSIFVPGQNHAKTVGSFFRNPLVTSEQADLVASFDESGKTKSQVHKMNQVHGGDRLRVSAAHVLLAAGFKRGQQWGPVRLHPDHVLKLENTGGATAQQIYDVAQEIINHSEQSLGIKLEPEARILGEF